MSRCSCFAAPVLLGDNVSAFKSLFTRAGALELPRGGELCSRKDAHRHVPVALARRPSPRGLVPVRRQYSTPFRPKQSLAQNFLQDANVIRKIVRAFEDSRELLSPDSAVIEIGAGTGALTQYLFPKYSDMTAIEIDSRAVEVLSEDYPELNLIHSDVLDIDWNDLRSSSGKPLAVIGNLPYNIVSQILFSMLESQRGVLGCAFVMMQKEVAERVCAKTRTKSYGILSVVGQLYAKPKLLFDVPPNAFYPKPAVNSTMVVLDFSPDPCLDIYNENLTAALRSVIRAAFQQRRKTLRNSLKTIVSEISSEVPEYCASKRPEELTPQQFVELTQNIYGKMVEKNLSEEDSAAGLVTPVWRARTKA